MQTIHLRAAIPQNMGYYQQLGYSILYEARHPGYDRMTYYQMGKNV